MTTDTQDLIARLRLGASISRDRNLNADAIKITEEAADKLDALQAEVARKSDAIQKLWKERDDALVENGKLRGQLEHAAYLAAAGASPQPSQADAQDAARYRWLTAQEWVNAGELDASIDAAINAKESGK